MANLRQLNLPPLPSMQLNNIQTKNSPFQKSELKTLECDILNPDLLINLEIKFMRTTSNI